MTLTDSLGKQFSPLNRSEFLVASYFLQEGVHFEHEPFKSRKGKNPDYLAKFGSVKVLVEVKELAESPLQRRLHAFHAEEANSPLPDGEVHLGQPFVLSPKESWGMLRDDVEEAARQLKPFMAEVDHSLVLLGCKEGLIDPPQVRDLYSTMFGDQRLVFERDAGLDGEARIAYTASGALLKHKPERQHVSAVGLVSECNPHEEYKARFYGHCHLVTAELEIGPAFDWAEMAWERHLPKVPERFTDTSATKIRIHAVSNPVAHRPLPRGLIGGSWGVTDTPGMA